MSVDKIDENLIILGSENSFVFFLDLRFKSSLAPLYEHMNEVCKVKYNPNMNMIVSGGNDNKIILYDIRGKTKCLKMFSHTAAIKALDFINDKPILISGGGTFDKRIKLWDLKKFELISEKLTDCQISNIYSWKNNIITANGFVANNIEMWKNDKGFHKLFQFKPHQKRILFLTKSVCEKYLLSGSCDGMINLWKIPEEQEKKNSLLENETLR
jgi:cell division cycle 20-like protein 1 (cofactor of APC complex)